MPTTASTGIRLPSVFARLQDRSFLSMLLIDAPPFVAALAIAETLFKFGSFLLEAIAFVALWVVLAFAHEQVLLMLRRVAPRIPAPRLPRRANS
jgi:hypothetical protein